MMIELSSQSGRVIVVTSAALLVFLPIILGGCAITTQAADGRVTRFGFVWDTFSREDRLGETIVDLRTIGIGLDTTTATGGIVIGYKSSKTFAVGPDSCMAVEMMAEQPQSTAP